jgi:hypothetical protein
MSASVSYVSTSFREPTPWPCFCTGNYRGLGRVVGRIVQRNTVTSYSVRVRGGLEMTMPAADVRPAGNVVAFVAGRDDWEIAI